MVYLIRLLSINHPPVHQDIEKKLSSRGFSHPILPTDKHCTNMNYGSAGKKSFTRTVLKYEIFRKLTFVPLMLDQCERQLGCSGTFNMSCSLESILHVLFFFIEFWDQVKERIRILVYQYSRIL